MRRSRGDLSGEAVGVSGGELTLTSSTPTQESTIEGALWGTRHRSDLSGEFGNEGSEEVLCGGAGGSELPFQLVDQHHQLIHFGYDTALFREGWEIYHEFAHLAQIKTWLSVLPNASPYL